MIPFQREGGNYVIFAQWPLPAAAPADSVVVTDAKADVINAETGVVLVADVQLVYDADSRGFFATRPMTDIDSIRFVQTRFKPTSTNTLVQTFTTAPRAVADILKRQDEHDMDIKAILEAIRGAGFDTSTDSLKEIRDAIDAIISAGQQPTGRMGSAGTATG